MGDAGAPTGSVASVGPDGRYVLVRQIGSGAMGTVHEARDTVLDRPVAVKLIDRRLTGDPMFHRRFANEAAILARLDSRSIVRVYDFGTTDDGLFLVTQFLPDGDLGTWLRVHGPLARAGPPWSRPRSATRSTRPTARGSCTATSSPATCCSARSATRSRGTSRTSGSPAREDSELTTTGGVLGTPSYMAPERHQGEEASPAGDVYAAGCVLWCSSPATGRTTARPTSRRWGTSTARSPSSTPPGPATTGGSGSTRCSRERWPRTRTSVTPAPRRWRPPSGLRRWVRPTVRRATTGPRHRWIPRRWWDPRRAGSRTAQDVARRRSGPAPPRAGWGGVGRPPRRGHLALRRWLDRRGRVRVRAPAPAPPTSRRCSRRRAAARRRRPRSPSASSP